MDVAVRKKIEQKISETFANKDEIRDLSVHLSDMDSSRSFVLGIIVGRIYNSFYYQTRRVLGRDPTDSEFQEFLTLVKNAKLDLW